MVEMGSFRVIRRVIELNESSDSEEDPDLERAIQLSLQPPGRPPIHAVAPVVERHSFLPCTTHRPFSRNPLRPNHESDRPRYWNPRVNLQCRVKWKCPSTLHPFDLRHPVMPRPQPPPSAYLPMNPQIIVYPGVWPPVAEPPSAAVIEDVADQPEEIRYTSEVVLDDVGSIRESRQTDRGAGSSRGRR